MSLQHKILRTANAPTTPPDETETAVAQALLDLENSVPELKTELRPLQISAAREIDVRGGKKAIVVFVPVPQLKAFHKVQARCVSHSGGGCGGIGALQSGAIPSSLAQQSSKLTACVMIPHHNLCLPPRGTILGLLASWRRNFPSVMSCLWHNAGCSANRRARRVSNKSGRVAGR